MNSYPYSKSIQLSFQLFWNEKKSESCPVRHNQQSTNNPLLQVVQMAHYLNSVFKSVSFKMENFTKQIDAYRHHYHKRMPVSNKANRYNINDNTNRGSKQNNSIYLKKQANLSDPLLSAGFHVEQLEEPKYSDKDLWQKFKQLQVEYLTRNYPFEKKQMFHRFALSKFNQMSPQSVKRYISQMQKLPINSSNKLEQNEDIDQYLQQISGVEDQLLKSSSKKQKLRQKIDLKQKKQIFQDNFFFVQQIDDLGMFLSNQPNSSNQQAGLKDAVK